MLSPVHQISNAADSAFISLGPISWNGKHYLDFLIYEAFFRKGDGDNAQAMQHGEFLEIGSADGVTNSFTLFFENYLNWHGILIEVNDFSKINISAYF